MSGLGLEVYTMLPLPIASRDVICLYQSGRLLLRCNLGAKVYA